jgi:hypothetical protein
MATAERLSPASAANRNEASKHPAHQTAPGDNVSHPDPPNLNEVVRLVNSAKITVLG